MIKSIEISNYRSCLFTKFDPHPNFSVLIGPNGSGKTNILRAITILRTLTENAEHHRHDDLFARESKLKVNFEQKNKIVSFTASLSMDTDQKNNDIIIRSKQLWNLKNLTGKKRIEIPLDSIIRGSQDEKWLTYSYFKILRDHKEVMKSLKGRLVELEEWATSARSVMSIAKSLQDIKYYSTSQFTDASQCPTSFEIEKDGPLRGHRFSDHAKFLFDLYTQFKSKNSNRYEQFKEIVGPKGIGLVDDISFKEISTSSIDYTVRSGGKVRELKRDKLLIIPQFIIGKNELSPSQLSEGTFRTLSLLFYIMTEISTILLIEEPEVCVHYGLLSSIIEMIKDYSQEKQIIISTHSDFVLDKVKPENVYMVSIKPEIGTRIVSVRNSMNKKDYDALREYLSTTGNLGEYWKEGALESKYAYRDHRRRTK